MKSLLPRDMILVSMFAALAAVGAIIFRWFGGAIVPFSIVPFIVLLAGCILGPRLGALSMIVYMLLGLVGVPVFEKPPFGTPVYLLQPTFGFIIGFIVEAYVCGKVLVGSKSPGLLRYIVATFAGTISLYIIGLPYLYFVLNFIMGQSFPVLTVLKIGFIPFVGWDILKGLVAASLAMAVNSRLHAKEYVFRYESPTVKD